MAKKKKVNIGYEVKEIEKVKNCIKCGKKTSPYLKRYCETCFKNKR